MPKDYKVSKVLNNNVILVTDIDLNQELILVGRGIGFGKKEGQEIRPSNSEIEKSFMAFDGQAQTEYFNLINQIDGNVMLVTEEIIRMAEKSLGELNPHIHIALTDHISFALDRIKEGLEMNNPFLYEIRALYPEEFRVGLEASRLIKDRLNIVISEAEIGFITLHIHSARQNKKVRDTLKDTRLLKRIMDLVQEELSIVIDNNDLIYSRLINHLRVTIQRVESNKHIRNPLLSIIKEQFKNSFTIAEKAGKYIEQEKGRLVSEDELGYLALHIERISEKTS